MLYNIERRGKAISMCWFPWMVKSPYNSLGGFCRFEGSGDLKVAGSNPGKKSPVSKPHSGVLLGGFGRVGPWLVHWNSLVRIETMGYS